MFKMIADFIGGKKIEERRIPVRAGNLKIILKERGGEKYIFMRFSYLGNIQYHVLYKNDVDETIEALTAYRNRL